MMRMSEAVGVKNIRTWTCYYQSRLTFAGSLEWRLRRCSGRPTGASGWSVNVRQVSSTVPCRTVNSYFTDASTQLTPITILLVFFHVQTMGVTHHYSAKDIPVAIAASSTGYINIIILPDRHNHDDDGK